MPIAAGIGAAGSIVSSVIGANAADYAAQKQAQAAANALDFQKGVYNTQLNNAQPYLAAGKTDLGTLQADLPSLLQGFDPASAGLPAQFSYGANDFHADPGYAFALQQGQQAIERSAAARGGDVSGGTLKDLSAFTVGQADQNYGNTYARALGTYQQNYGNAFNTFETGQQNTFNRLGSLVNTGLSANNQAAGAGQNFANNAGNYAIQSGNAQAAGIVGASNAISQGIAGATGSISNGLLLQKLLGQQGGANSGSGYGPYTPPAMGTVSPSQWAGYDATALPPSYNDANGYAV